MSETPEQVAERVLVTAVRRMSLPPNPTRGAEITAEAEGTVYAQLVVEALRESGHLA